VIQVFQGSSRSLAQTFVSVDVRGGLAAFSRTDELDTLLAHILHYQDTEREEKLISFTSQLPVHLTSLKLGEYSGNA
jgi:hypothetical protein